jgi:hypothetical protein
MSRSFTRGSRLTDRRRTRNRCDGAAASRDITSTLRLDGVQRGDFDPRSRDAVVEIESKGRV